MTRNHRARRWAATGAGLALALASHSTACGGNLGRRRRTPRPRSSPAGTRSRSSSAQDPGGSTDLIARALAEPASDDLGVPVTVENKPGANGALAAQELAGAHADGHTLMVFNGSLAYITPLAVSPRRGRRHRRLRDRHRHLPGRLRPRDRARPPASAPSQDLVDAGRPITFGTTGVGTGSQLVPGAAVRARPASQATRGALRRRLAHADRGARRPGRRRLDPARRGRRADRGRRAHADRHLRRGAAVATCPTRPPPSRRATTSRCSSRGRSPRPKGTPHDGPGPAARGVPDGVRVRGLPAVQRGEPAHPQRGRRRRAARAVDRQPRRRTAGWSSSTASI